MVVGGKGGFYEMAFFIYMYSLPKVLFYFKRVVGKMLVFFNSNESHRTLFISLLWFKKGTHL